jgi:2,4-dienoyl-CoA reductase (NADPH2)
MASKYPALFQPMKLKNLTLKNRICKAGQWFIYAEPDGSCGDRIIGWYEGLAKSGPGMITIEESICEFPLGASMVPHIRLDHDKFIPGLTRLASAIHKHGVPVMMMITHAGPAHNPAVTGGKTQPIAPSKLDPPAEPTQVVAREMTTAEVEERMEMFAQAALRSKKAGFDGVELHFAHYALGNAMLSRYQNHRTDKYGTQNMENRTRFGVGIIKRVRELCGNDFVIGSRISMKEWDHPLGTTLEEGIEIAKIFEKAGLDYIQASQYGYNNMYLCTFPDLVLYPEVAPVAKEFAARIDHGGALIPEAALTKKAVKVPVSGAGRLSFAEADKAIKDGKIDMAVFGRQFMADPEFPKKLAEGREDDIRKCSHCLHCLHVMFTYQPVQCRCNPFAGNETTMVIKPAAKKKNVMVVGAGPAGLEAARVASLRGHNVSLWDSAKDIGGSMPMASFIKGTDNDNLPEFISWFGGQLKKQGVKMNLGKTVTAATVAEEKPDAVILALGAEGLKPTIPIKAGASVTTTDELRAQASRFVNMLGSRAMNSLTKIFLPMGKKVVVIGSDLPGIEAAEFLVKRGKEVTIVDDAPAPFVGVDIQWLIKLPFWLPAKGVQMYNGVKFEEISKKGVAFTTSDGKKMNIPADSVMIVNKHKKNDKLYNELKGKVPELYLIGDASSDDLGYVFGATHGAAELALKI